MSDSGPSSHRDITNPLTDVKTVSSHFSNCTHCGFCLAVCPTYKLTGDENNSPRGRLRLWSDEFFGALKPDSWTDFYTAECVGCLACETACPAHVPYGELFEKSRHKHSEDGRAKIGVALKVAAAALKLGSLFDWAFLPARMLRRIGLLPHPLVFPGQPALVESTADYAEKLMRIHRPDGQRVALLTGCLMESLFREINFATVRVLVENNIQVFVPRGQVCCGAFQQHCGLGGEAENNASNRTAFGALNVEVVLTNSAGCGYALGRGLAGQVPVKDVLVFLGDKKLVRRTPEEDGARLYVDLPCHLVHGQKVSGIPQSVLDATGLRWELAPQARDCCGSGGVYNIQKPENAREILASKASFLDTAEGSPVILGTSNHVCMMQWFSAGATGIVSRPYLVKHIVQLLDPGEVFERAR